jgi:broad specificity phosphatase PhoE
MAALLMVRHGQASFGADDYDALSALGIEQARLTGQALARRGLTVQRAVQGGMRRHAETARHCLAEMRGAPAVTTDARLNEFDHQDVLGCARPELREPAGLKAYLAKAPEPAKAFHRELEAGMARWMGGTHDGDYRESWPQFKARCAAVLRELMAGTDASGAPAPTDTIIVFTSGGPIALAMQAALGLPDAAVLTLNAALVNASTTRLPFTKDRLFVGWFNDYAHLEAGGESRKTHR